MNFCLHPIFKLLTELILNKESQDEDYIFEINKPGLFPKLTVNMYDRKTWTSAAAKTNFLTYMQCLGFGRNGTGKTYKCKNDEPAGWPDSISFVEMEHPSYLGKDDIKTVIESLLRYRQINPETYFLETAVEKVTRKRKKTKKSAEIVEEEPDEAQDVVKHIMVDEAGHLQEGTLITLGMEAS